MSYFPDSFINRQYVDNRDRLRKYLGADINVHVVYNRLGNGINKELTHRFIESGFDMNLLYKEVKE